MLLRLFNIYFNGNGFEHHVKVKSSWHVAPLFTEVWERGREEGVVLERGSDEEIKQEGGGTNTWGMKPRPLTHTNHSCKDPRVNCTFDFQTSNCIWTALLSSPLSLSHPLSLCSSLPLWCPGPQRDSHMALLTSTLYLLFPSLSLRRSLSLPRPLLLF